MPSAEMLLAVVVPLAIWALVFLGSSRVTVMRLLNLLERQGQVVRFKKRSGTIAQGGAGMRGSSRAILLPQRQQLSQG